MSRITKWKIEKAKVKVVFRLQFHATHIPQSGWEKLFISFIPNETGKATAKTSKANVRNGTCKWADPIYETTRLLLDSKTKQYDDKLYKLVVGMGTSRSSILGEATINLADYADASQPSVINLPLHGSDHGTILHVTVQLLTSKTGFREFEQQRDKGLQRESESSAATSPSTDSQIPDDQLSMGNKTQRQIRQQSKDLLEETGIHEEYSDSHVTCDDSSNTSENYKNDPSITHEVDSLKKDVSADLAIAYEENHRLRGSLEVAESAITELKMELNTLQNHANEMCTETQKLQENLATEIASSQELAKEVTVLKSECSKFKNDLQHLKEMKMFNFGEIPKLPFKEPELSDMGKAERESLVKKMEQMESYYEGLVQDLEENQKKILEEFQSYKNETNDKMIRFDEERRELNSIIKDLQKRATTSESALKRARLNYSIAVSQLQKDLDMLSFQVLSMFETNQTVIKEAFSDSSEGHEDLVDDIHRSKNLSGGGGGGDVLSGDLKKSLSMQENIYKKVEEELGEMCASNLYLDVYSGAVSETLFEASGCIKKIKEKLEEVGQELEVSNKSRDVLFMKLQNVTEDVRMLNVQNSYYLEKCNDLQLQNQMLEKDLGSVSRENFLLMEKITECEALLMDYKVYKSKYEVVSGEKGEVEGILKVQVFEKQNLEKDLEFVKKELDMARLELDEVKMRFNNVLHETVVKLGIPNESFEKIQFQVESVSKKLKNSLDLGESNLENGEVILRHLSGLELELQKILSEDRNFVDQVNGLEKIVGELEESKLMISEFRKENQDFVLEIERMKERLEFVNDELDVEKGIKGKLERTVECLTSDLESQRLEVDHVRKLALKQESENSRVVQEMMICEDLKQTYVKSQYESKIEGVVKQCKELDKNKDLRLNDIIKSEALHIKEKEKLSKTIESVRLECKELQMKLDNMEARLNEVVESEAHYIKENELLSKTVESVKLELEASVAHNAEILESKNVLEEWKDKAGVFETSLMEVKSNHDLELGQLRDMLAKSELEIVKLKELEMKLHDMEERLNHSLENEACLVKDNEKLSKELESVKLELKETLELNNGLKGKMGILEINLTEVKNQHEVELQKLKDMLEKSDLDVEKYKEVQMKLEETETRLNEILESKNVLEGKMGILEVSLTEVNNQHEVEVEKCKELQMKLHETEIRLNEVSESKNVLEGKMGILEVSLTEVNNQHEMEVEKCKEVQMKLHETETRLNEVSESKNVLEGKMGILENNLTDINNQHEVELCRLRDMLEKSDLEVEKSKELQLKLHETETRLNEVLKSESCYIEENKKLSRTLESVQLEFNNSIAQKVEISKANNNHALEISQLKEILVKSEVEIGQLKELETELLETKTRFNQIVKSEAFYIQENESLKSELDAIMDKVKFLETNKVAEVDDVPISQQESEILLMVLKSKLYEQNDELLTLKNKCSELSNKLSEQISKTEEFKNMYIYLKELKENADVIAREKKESEGPSESLRLAFIKEQYQAKIQELKQQISVSKRHNEEMLFKLQDALEEIENRKKSEVIHLKRIEELEAEVELVISQKPAHDRIQAELECAILSLECCKEEKEKLVGLLHESEEEKMKLECEVSLIKEQFAQKDENGHVGVNGESERSFIPVNSLAIEGGVQDEDEENSLINDSKQLTVFNDQFRTQHLRSCMEQLDEKLERMKNDNSIVPFANYDSGLQKELSQLQKANEELGSIYPNFTDFAGNGNALERVLALEIELAEALRAKKKSSIQFQSSFLKQHSDEEAVFKSFHDINELIKDMLEIKGKYVNVESELKDMHDRYSQLSLQFAEVEGERQKLMMTLKNVRSSRNLLRLNRSSMAVVEDRAL